MKINVSSSRSYYKPNIDYIPKIGKSLGEKKYYRNAYRSKAIAILKATFLTNLWLVIVLVCYYSFYGYYYNDWPKAHDLSLEHFKRWLAIFGVWYWFKNFYDRIKV